MSAPTGSEPRHDERFFFRVLVIMALAFATGFCLLLFALNQHEKETSPPSANLPPRFISPDHPRQLVNFSLTDRTGRQVTRSELDGKILVVDFLFTQLFVDLSRRQPLHGANPATHHEPAGCNARLADG
ncbi:MAG: hypothetical protein ACLQAH_06845 [Limisphaerales bacterium]